MTLVLIQSISILIINHIYIYIIVTLHNTMHTYVIQYITHILMYVDYNMYCRCVYLK